MGGGPVSPGIWQHSVNAARVPSPSVTSLLGTLEGCGGPCKAWPGLSSWHVNEARERSVLARGKGTART